MPVKIPNGLPAAEILARENIFTMSSDRADTQDIRPLRIAILNLMPTKLETETQLLRLIGNTALQVDVVLLHTASYKSRNIGAEHLEAFYRTFEEVENEHFDGLIITGAPVERMEFEKVAYWDELTRILDWAETNVFSSLFICWGAQAALYHYYGIEKRPLERKLFGVFRHSVISPTHRLLRGFDDVFFVPHSRYTTVNAEDIAADGNLELLAVSEEAGIYLAASRDGSRIFVMGHGEYDSDTLGSEFLRDRKAGLSVSPPSNYYPDDDITKEPRVRWRSHANLLFSNWLNYFVYQETPYDISKVPLSKHGLHGLHGEGRAPAEDCLHGLHGEGKVPAEDCLYGLHGKGTVPAEDCLHGETKKEVPSDAYLSNT